MLVIGIPGVAGQGLAGNFGEGVEVLDLLTEVRDRAGTKVKAVITFYDELGGLTGVRPDHGGATAKGFDDHQPELFEPDGREDEGLAFV